MSSGNSRSYLMGVSLIVVGLSATVSVVPREGVLGGFISIKSGGGTLSLVNGASAISSDGYNVSATDRVEFNGPAKFFLAAAGATMTAAYVMRYSAGATLG
jgi:hypothetical protein